MRVCVQRRPDPFSTRHVKGVRGDVRSELDELATLAPELRVELDKLEKQRIADAGKRHAHAAESSTHGPRGGPSMGGKASGSAGAAGVKRARAALSSEATAKIRAAIREDGETGEGGKPESKRARIEGAEGDVSARKPRKVSIRDQAADGLKSVFAATSAAPAKSKSKGEEEDVQF